MLIYALNVEHFITVVNANFLTKTGVTNISIHNANESFLLKVEIPFSMVVNINVWAFVVFGTFSP